MILVSGFNVYPNEVEDVIAAHPGVLEVAAVGIPDPNSGESVKVVIVRKDPSLTSESVIEFARKSLTNYKIPRVVEFRTKLQRPTSERFSDVLFEKLKLSYSKNCTSQYS